MDYVSLASNLSSQTASFVSEDIFQDLVLKGFELSKKTPKLSDGIMYDILVDEFFKRVRYYNNIYRHEVCLTEIKLPEFTSCIKSER